MWSLLLVLAAVFIGYAIYKFYAAPGPGESVATKVWSAIVLAAASAGAWVAWFFDKLPTGGSQ